jgi:hypothetical protein
MKHGSTVIAFVEDPSGYKVELIQLGTQGSESKIRINTANSSTCNHSLDSLDSGAGREWNGYPANNYK